MERESSQTSEYSERLSRFNMKPEYWKEVNFLSSLMGDNCSPVLDFGCGLGTAANYLELEGKQIDGYDIHHYNPGFKYIDSPLKYFKTVFFMHSFSHLSNPKKTLNEQREWMRKGSKLIIITPNPDFLQAIGQPFDYKPDETVVKHYSMLELEIILKQTGFKIIQQGQFGKYLPPHNERLFIVAERDFTFKPHK